MEEQYIKNPNRTTLNNLVRAKYELNNFFSQKAEYSLYKLKQKWYESGNKAGKLLASQFKAKRNAQHISAIRNKEDKTITDPRKMNQVFTEFYKKLYSKEGQFDISSANIFFDSLNLPKLSKKNADDLERPITLKEVKRAIITSPIGKAGGSDGICNEFYKKFVDLLSPELLTIFNNIIDSEQLPNSMSESVITLILKKDKDPLECGSYRPISLMCCDGKLFTKILATRLNEVLPKLIHHDQVGFVKGRKSSNSMRRLLHLIWKAKDLSRPTAVLSMDAQKAFDRVCWEYLHYVLGQFGFGKTFQKIVQTLYKNSKSIVTTNGLNSSPFQMERGTKQGDPLSPLLIHYGTRAPSHCNKVKQGNKRNQNVRPRK